MAQITVKRTGHRAKVDFGVSKIGSRMDMKG